MANVTQLKHLEHIEDEILNHGSAGCVASVSAMQELLRMLGKKPSSGYMQTKWDGAPSVVCGKHPVNGMFFVGTKSVFNKTDPKICYTQNDVDIHYGDASPDLKSKLKMCIQYFPSLNMGTVCQGDLLFTSDVKTEEIDGEKLYTFKPNAITYGIPTDHPLGQQIKTAKIGIVFHTSYTGTEVATMTAKAGAPKMKSTSEVFLVENDTPMDDISVDRSTLSKFEQNVSIVESMCKKSEVFLDHLVDNMGTTGNKKFHVASYLKQFFNAEIRGGRSIGNAQTTLKALGEFYHEKMMAVIDKLKSDKTIMERRKQMYDGIEYLEKNEQNFVAMLTLYTKIIECKDLVMSQLDHLETFKTYVQTDKGYKVTNPEGYVLHHNGDMIKLVNRIEFSYINFTLAKSWK
tara:strand:- start:24 stop:1229 length:1206 start_codon:yes stop_codon:yes gene_type:complete